MGNVPDKVVRAGAVPGEARVVGGNAPYCPARPPSVLQEKACDRGCSGLDVQNPWVYKVISNRSAELVCSSPYWIVRRGTP